MDRAGTWRPLLLEGPTEVTGYGRFQALDEISERVLTLGYSNLVEFLEARPGSSYEEIAAELGCGAPIQVLSLHYRQAKAQGKLRWAARDSLVRTLRSGLPTGWSSDEPGRLGWPENRALSGWCSEILVTGESPEVESQLHAVIGGLVRHASLGWLPEGPDDATVVAAFEEGWPTR